MIQNDQYTVYLDFPALSTSYYLYASTWIFSKDKSLQRIITLLCMCKIIFKKKTNFTGE